MEEPFVPEERSASVGERAFFSDRDSEETAEKVTLSKAIQSLETRSHFLDGYERKKTASLIWMGSVFGIVGFCFAFLIGLFEYLAPIQLQGKGFPSGVGYFPATIAEMVHNPHEPTGKVFFGFCFTSGMFLFASWYPWELRNVYTGDDETICKVSWPMLRQYVSPIGYMLSVTITAKPWTQATPEDMFTIAINQAGKVMFIFGFIICEWHTLWVSHPNTLGNRTKAVIKTREMKLRISMLFWVFSLMLGFFCLGSLVAFLPGSCPDLPKQYPWIGTYDTWSKDEKGDESHLTDTATGLFFLAKVLTYVCDSGIGLVIMYSHLLIWWFCDERHVDLHEKLRKAQKLMHSTEKPSN